MFEYVWGCENDIEIMASRLSAIDQTSYIDFGNSKYKTSSKLKGWDILRKKIFLEKKILIVNLCLEGKNIVRWDRVTWEQEQVNSNILQKSRHKKYPHYGVCIMIRNLSL